MVRLILLLLIISSCATRKVDTNISKDKIVTEVEVKETDQTEINEVKETNEKITQFLTVDSFKGIVSDSSRPATIERLKLPNGAYLTTFVNFKQVESSLNKQNEEIQRAIKEIKDVKKDVEIIATANNKEVKREKNKQIESKKGIPWWLIIVLVLLLVLYFYNRRQT